MSSMISTITTEKLTTRKRRRGPFTSDILEKWAEQNADDPEVVGSGGGNGGKRRRKVLANGARKGNMKGKGGPENLSCPYKGVRQRTTGKWVAEIRDPKGGRLVWLGTFKTAYEAALAFDKASMRMHGSRAQLNIPEAAVMVSSESSSAAAAAAAQLSDPSALPISLEEKAEVSEVINPFSPPILTTEQEACSGEVEQIGCQVSDWVGQFLRTDQEAMLSGDSSIAVVEQFGDPSSDSIAMPLLSVTQQQGGWDWQEGYAPRIESEQQHPLCFSPEKVNAGLTSENWAWVDQFLDLG